MSSFIVPVLIKVATDSSVIKASWKVLIGFCQTTLHMSPQTQRHAVTAMFVSSHQHPILQFSCDVRSAEEKLVIWTSCRERGTFLWEVSVNKCFWEESHRSTLEDWLLKNESNEKRAGCSKRRVGALLGERVVSMWCWGCCLEPVLQPLRPFQVFLSRNTVSCDQWRRLCIFHLFYIFWRGEKLLKETQWKWFCCSLLSLWCVDAFSPLRNLCVQWCQNTEHVCSLYEWNSETGQWSLLITVITTHVVRNKELFLIMIHIDSNCQCG